jgi:hypothetical protein
MESARRGTAEHQGVTWARAAAIVALGVAACGRIDFDDLGDARHGDASADTALHSVETITVPVDGTSVMSTTVLAAGVAYRLEASGGFFTGGSGDGSGDAEYSNFDAPSNLATNQMVDFGLAIDDPTPALTKTPVTWGAYTPTHVYDVTWTGSGAAIAINLHDDFPSNNTGTLTLAIFGP